MPNDDIPLRNRGYRVKALVKNQKGLNYLYRLVTLSHTNPKNFFRNPRIFFSDLLEHRKGLILGASGDKDGEIFSLFSAFNSEIKRKQRIKFYDYIEISSLGTLRHQ